MSTKTLRKRIALVAVSALTAGILSVVSAPASSAANNSAIGSASPAPVSGTLNIATGTTALTQVGTAVQNINGTGSVSIGLLSVKDYPGVTGTATMLSSGTLVAYGQTADGKALTLQVTGGTIQALGAADTGYTDSANLAVSADRTLLSLQASGAVSKAAIAVRPNSGVTTMTVAMYEKTIAYATTTPAAILSGALSKGDLVGKYDVTIASTNASGAYSAANSFCNAAVSGNATVDGVDQADSLVVENGSSVYINYQLLDIYDNAIPDTGAIVISTTAGALVGHSATLGNTAQTMANITAVTNANEGTVKISQSTSNKPVVGNVTISYNGAVICTKSFKITGEVAKVTASDPVIARTGASNADAFRVRFYDSADNQLYIGDATTAARVAVVSTTLNTVVTNASVPTGSVAATNTAAKGTVVCNLAITPGSGLGSGTADLQLQYTNPSGNVVKSNVWKQACAGDAYTFTASHDKATYTWGQLATLSISFKDSSGAAINAYQEVSASGSNIGISGGPAATAITAPGNSDEAGSRGVDAPGVKTYQFITDTTTRDAATIVAVTIAGLSSSQGKVTVPYSVKSNSTDVSNNEILKSIVALIASINKQIQALQKLILKR